MTVVADLAELRLLQLADSALPIGALAHSFGLESLVASELLRVGDLPDFLRAYIDETGFVEAAFCREAFALASANLNGITPDFAARWFSLNLRLSVLKPARESREASASLGRNFLRAIAALDPSALLRRALEVPAPRAQGGAAHHCTAFGLAGGVLGLPEHGALAAFLHQSAAGLVSACQRLLPLGQTEAARLLWDLKPAILETVARASRSGIEDVHSFTPLLEWGAMEHPALPTRLFIS